MTIEQLAADVRHLTAAIPRAEPLPPNHRVMKADSPPRHPECSGLSRSEAAKRRWSDPAKREAFSKKKKELHARKRNK